MFKPTILHHQSCNDQCKSYLPDTFSVLSWNVYKNNKKTPFIRYLEKKVKEKDLQLLLFQEATFQNSEHFSLPQFHYDAAANIEVKKKFYGVMTASKVQSTYANAYLSEGQEAFVGPYKSMLLSSYEFKDKAKLLVLNVHVINFRENECYNRELDRFFEFISTYEGPLILAGDFNSWNLQRKEKLYEYVYKLKLKTVTFGSSTDIKSFLGNNLDFIFYKGLTLIDSSVEKTGLSDHNPLFATFKRT